MFPPINQIPFTTLHELNMDWLLNELVARFNAVVQQFNQIVDQFNNMSNKFDNLEADYVKFKQDTQSLLEQIKELADKLTPETIEELLELVNSFNQVTVKLNKLQQNLENEQDARMEADTTLQANIDAEKTAREAADTTLQANIDAEKTAREAADKTLQDQIDTLTEGSGENAGAIGNLRSDLAAEKTARKNRDNQLAANIDTVESTLNTEIDSIWTTLNDDVIGDDGSKPYYSLKELENQIDNEIAARENQYNSLSDIVDENYNDMISRGHVTVNIKRKTKQLNDIFTPSPEFLNHAATFINIKQYATYTSNIFSQMAILLITFDNAESLHLTLGSIPFTAGILGYIAAVANSQYSNPLTYDSTHAIPGPAYMGIAGINNQLASTIDITEIMHRVQVMTQADSPITSAVSNMRIIIPKSLYPLLGTEYPKSGTYPIPTSFSTGLSTLVFFYPGAQWTDNVIV